MADISSITLPGGGTYDLKDKNAVPRYGKGKNLLRNWYFVGGGTGRGIFPVNQRGQTTYQGAGARTFGVDNWYVYWSSAKMTVESGSLYLESTTSSPNGVLSQTLPSEFAGKTVTASILYKDSTGSFKFYNSDTTFSEVSGLASATYELGVDSTFSVKTDGASHLRIIAAKLELGTEQTLCHQENGTWVLNEIPDYEYELYRCITSTADPSDTYANKSLATRQDLTSIQATGTTNTTGAAIPAGAYFYLNGVLYQAKTRIDQNATFTVNTNCKQVLEGGFNSLKAQTLVRRQAIATSITTGLNEWVVAADAVSGYKPIGIVGVQFAALPRSAVTLSQFLLEGTNIVVGAQSTQTKTSGMAVYICVLYAKE